MGFNRNFPREVVYASKRFGGIGLRDLHCEQGIGQIIHLVSHLRTRTPTSTYFHTLINNYQLLSGLSTPILETTHPIPGTRNNWLSHLCSFLHTINFKLRLFEPWVLPPL